MKTQNNLDLLIEEALELDLLDIDVQTIQRHKQLIESIDVLKSLGFISVPDGSSKVSVTCDCCSDCGGCGP